MNRFLVIEGPDGSGKSTLGHLLQEEIRKRGASCTLLREPGSSPLGERLRSIIADPDLQIGPRAETLLFCAARAELANTIRQELQRGWVLLDRYEGSTLVYQGIVRGLGVEEVQEISRWSSQDLRPDRTLVLLLDPEKSLGRRAHRPEDRMEATTDTEAVLRGYRELARMPGYRAISADGTPEDALRESLEALSDLLEEAEAAPEQKIPE